MLLLRTTELVSLSTGDVSTRACPGGYGGQCNDRCQRHGEGEPCFADDPDRFGFVHLHWTYSRLRSSLRLMTAPCLPPPSIKHWISWKRCDLSHSLSLFSRQRSAGLFAPRAESAAQAVRSRTWSQGTIARTGSMDEKWRRSSGRKKNRQQFPHLFVKRRICDSCHGKIVTLGRK